VILRRIDQRIMNKEFKIGFMKLKVETLKTIKQAIEKK